MLDMTLEQGHQVFLNALSGNNFSAESVRAYSADISQFIEFLQTIRVDWNNPKKLERLDIVGGYPLKAGQLEYDCRYSTMHGMPVTGGRGFRGLKPLWYNGVPP